MPTAFAEVGISYHYIVQFEVVVGVTGFVYRIQNLEKLDANLVYGFVA